MVILVTRCVSIIKCDHYYCYEFHFKGFLKGEKVERVKLKLNSDEFEIKEDYLIAMKAEKIKKGTLTGSLLKFKKL